MPRVYRAFGPRWSQSTTPRIANWTLWQMIPPTKESDRNQIPQHTTPGALWDTTNRGLSFLVQGSCIAGSSTSSYKFFSSFLCQIIIRTGVSWGRGTNGEPGTKKNLNCGQEISTVLYAFFGWEMGNQTIPLHSLGVYLRNSVWSSPNIDLCELRLNVSTWNPSMTSSAPSEMVAESWAIWAK